MSLPWENRSKGVKLKNQGKHQIYFQDVFHVLDNNHKLFLLDSIVSIYK